MILNQQASLVAITVLILGGTFVSSGDLIAASNAPTDGLPEAEFNSAVQAGHEALESAAKFPWYDATTDARRTIDLPTSDAPLTSPDWVTKRKTPQPANPTPTLKPRRSWNFAWSEGTVWFMQMAGWTVLAVATGVLIYYWLRMISLATTGQQAVETLKRRTEAELIEKLPFQVKRPTNDLLAEARRQYELGNYNEAIVYLYSHQLVQLDRHRMIVIDKGKTNRQYLAELRNQPALRDWLTNTMLAFEDVFFGHYALNAERFEVCWNPLSSFHQTLDQLKTSAGVPARK